MTPYEKVIEAAWAVCPIAIMPATVKRIIAACLASARESGCNIPKIEGEP